MTIKACLFDMGNVLVYFSHEQMSQNVAEASGASLDVVRNILVNDGLLFRLECGQITEEQFHEQFQKLSATSIEKTKFLTAIADIFEVNESIVPLLAELKSLGIRLVLLSNTSITHLNFIQRQFSILNVFDDMTTSFQVEALKPDDAIYEDAIQKSGCLPNECFYTDDIEPYVIKGRDLGLNAEIYTTTSLTRQTLRELGVTVGEQ